MKTSTRGLPSIDFEGVMVDPKRGCYVCPFRCGRQDYPTPKWKTEKGFRKHMGECPQRPSRVQKEAKE
jgi:hypothetical protein